jgi:hypothetical protein
VCGLVATMDSFAISMALVTPLKLLI